MKARDILCLLLAVFLGAASGFAAARYTSPRFATVSVKEIAEEKKQELIRDFQRDESRRAELEEEYRDFLLRLDSMLEGYVRKGVILLRKEAVVAGSIPDVTDDLRRRLRQKE